MKRALLAVALTILVIGFDSCVEEPHSPQDPKELQLKLLSDTWSYKHVTQDGVEQPGFENFKLTFAGTPGADSFNYVTSGRPPHSPWPSSGTWQFRENFQNELSRDINTNIQIDILYTISSDGKLLEMSFNYQGDGFSRLDDIKGSWVFTFNRGQNTL